MARDGYKSITLNDETYDRLEALRRELIAKQQDSITAAKTSVPDVVGYLLQFHNQRQKLNDTSKD